MTELIYPDECYQIIGACFRVYNTIGCGFLEAVYQECLEIELGEKRINFEPQKELKLYYHTRELKQYYKADFLCWDKIILEIKAVSILTDEHYAQMLNYLHASKKKLGLLVNFGHHPGLEYKRFILTKNLNTK